MLLKLHEVSMDKEPNEECSKIFSECSKIYSECKGEVRSRNGDAFEEHFGGNEEVRESDRVSREDCYEPLENYVEGYKNGIPVSAREGGTGKFGRHEIESDRSLEGGKEKGEENGRMEGLGKGKGSELNKKDGNKEENWMKKGKVTNSRESFLKYEAGDSSVEENFAVKRSPERIAMKNKFSINNKEGIDAEFAFDISDNEGADVESQDEGVHNISESPTKKPQRKQLKSKLPSRDSRKSQNAEEKDLNFNLEIQETKVQPTNIGYNFPKFKKNAGQFESGSPFSHDLKISAKVNEKSKKSISLHRKMISFEEDCDNVKPTGLTQLVSPLQLSNGFANFDFVDETINSKNCKEEKSSNIYEEEKIEANINENPEIFNSKTIGDEVNEKSVPSETLKDLGKECIINLQSKFNNEFSKKLEFSSDSSLHSSYSSKKAMESSSPGQMALESSSSRRQALASSSSSKKVLEAKICNSQLSHPLTKPEGISEKRPKTT